MDKGGQLEKTKTYSDILLEIHSPRTLKKNWTIRMCIGFKLSISN